MKRLLVLSLTLVFLSTTLAFVSADVTSLGAQLDKMVIIATFDQADNVAIAGPDNVRLENYDVSGIGAFEDGKSMITINITMEPETDGAVLNAEISNTKHSLTIHAEGWLHLFDNERIYEGGFYGTTSLGDKVDVTVIKHRDSEEVWVALAFQSKHREIATMTFGRRGENITEFMVKQMEKDRKRMEATETEQPKSETLDASTLLSPDNTHVQTDWRYLFLVNGHQYIQAGFIAAYKPQTDPSAGGAAINNTRLWSNTVNVHSYASQIYPYVTHYYNYPVKATTNMSMVNSYKQSCYPASGSHAVTITIPYYAGSLLGWQLYNNTIYVSRVTQSSIGSNPPYGASWIWDSTIDNAIDMDSKTRDWTQLQTEKDTGVLSYYAGTCSNPGTYVLDSAGTITYKFVGSDYLGGPWYAYMTATSASLNSYYYIQ